MRKLWNSAQLERSRTGIALSSFMLNKVHLTNLNVQFVNRGSSNSLYSLLQLHIMGTFVQVAER